MSRASMSHEQLEVLIAADAVGGLDEADRREMLRTRSEHGPDCAVCVRLASDYSEVAAQLALALDPIPMSAGAEDVLLDAIGRTGDMGMLEDRRPPIGPARRRRWRWAAAVAAAAALAIVAGVVGYSVAPRGSRTPAELVEFVAQPGTRTVAFPVRDGQRLAVAYRPGERQAWVIGSSFDAPPSGRVYELWYVPTGSEGVQPAGTFVPEDGIIAVPVKVGSSFTTLAVSVEPGFRSQPTTTPILVAKVSAG
jgi:anti-sigma-K factor RskA